MGEERVFWSRKDVRIATPTRILLYLSVHGEQQLLCSTHDYVGYVQG